MKAGPHPALAQGKVRYVGDHVARGRRRDAGAGEGRGRGRSPSTTRCCRRSSTPPRRRRAGARRSTRSRPTTPSSRWHLGDKAAVDAAFATAKHVTKLDIVNNRLVPNAIEPRAAIGEYDPRRRAATRSTPRARTRTSARLVISAFVGIAPEHKLRVIAPDVGGGFGSKIFIYAEETVCLWAAKKVGRPVKWTADRTEAFLSRRARPRPRHPRRDGDRRGRQDPRDPRVTPSPISAPTCRPSPPRCRPTSTRRCSPASTTSRRSIARSTRVYTNTAPVDAYRGAGRPEATFVVERLVEIGGARDRHGPGRVPPRNFIKKLPAPDAGDHDLRRRRLSRPRSTKALELADYNGFARRKRESAPQRQAPRHRLLVLHRGLRHRALGGGRLARRRRRPVGIGRGAGQSDRLGRGPDRLAQPRPGPRDHLRAAGLRPARHPDRQRVHRPRRHRQGAVRHGHLRLALRRGRHVGDRQGARQGRSPRARRSRPTCWRPPRATSSSRTASSRSPAPTSRSLSATWRCRPTSPTSSPARSSSPGLKEGAFYDPTNFTFPAGVHICEVEVDPDTGIVAIDDGPRSTISASSSTR